MDLNKENMKKMRELIVFTAIILIGLWNYRILVDWAKFAFGIIFPFLLGGGIAFVLNVPMSFLEEKLFKNRHVKDKKVAQRLARPVSLVLTIAMVIGVIVLVMFVVIPELTRTVISLGKTVQVFIPEAQRFLEDLFTNSNEVREWLGSLNINVDEMIGNIINFFKNGAGNVLNSTVYAIGSIVSAVTTFVIAFVFACYILLQKEKLCVQAKKVVHAFLNDKWEHRFLEVCALTSKSFSSFLTGQCLEALILGTMFFVTMSILKMPYALLVGVLIAFTALIPIFGAFIGCVVGTFLILMVNPMKALIFLVMFFVLQQLEGNLIYPKVVGNSVGLPSIWVLAAVTIGGSLMGVVGMLIFIPLVSVVYALFRKTVYKRIALKDLKASDKQEQAIIEKEIEKENGV